MLFYLIQQDLYLKDISDKIKQILESEHNSLGGVFFQFDAVSCLANNLNYLDVNLTKIMSMQRKSNFLIHTCKSALLLRDILPESLISGVSPVSLGTLHEN